MHSKHFDRQLVVNFMARDQFFLDLVYMWVVIRLKANSVPKESCGGGYCRISRVIEKRKHLGGSRPPRRQLDKSLVDLPAAHALGRRTVTGTRMRNVP